MNDVLLHVLEDALYLGAQGQAVEKLLEGLPGEVFPLDALRLRERHGEEGERERGEGKRRGKQNLNERMWEKNTAA